MEKVVIAAPVHKWDDVRVFKKQAVSLAATGLEVVLVARSSAEMDVDGVKVIPCKSFYKSRITRFLSLIFIYFQLLGLRGDIYHLHNPDTIPLAWFLKLAGKKVIYDTHEDFTQRILTRSWIYPSIRRLIARVVGVAERFTARVCDAAIATQLNVVQRLGKKAILIENPPRMRSDLLEEVHEYSSKIASPREFRLIYIGWVGATRGLYEMVDALPLVNKHVECRLWLIGPAIDSELQLAKSREGWKFVDYLPSQPQEVAFSYVVKSDVGLIYLNDVGGHSGIDPNKIYEYMAFSKPFIASNFKKWRDKLEFLNAGLFVEAGSSERLAESVIVLSSMHKAQRELMGENGFNYVCQNNWEKEFLKVKSIYSKILNSDLQ